MSKRYKVTGPWPQDEQPWHVTPDPDTGEGDVYFTDDREAAEAACERLNRGELA
jgi:hypothetical protein